MRHRNFKKVTIQNGDKIDHTFSIFSKNYMENLHDHEQNQFHKIIYVTNQLYDTKNKSMPKAQKMTNISLNIKKDFNIPNN